MCEGIIEHGQHIGRRDDARVMTPGGDQQSVVALNREKERILPKLVIASETSVVCPNGSQHNESNKLNNSELNTFFKFLKIL